MRAKFHQCDVKNRGKIERVTYTVKNSKGDAVEKYANVYLPYGYDGVKKYNILYLMHGGGGNPDAWLDSCMLKNMLDHSFCDEGVEPCIVVMPTFYTDTGEAGFDPDGDGRRTMAFQTELKEVLIPAVEGKYCTYAETTDAAGQKASRMHRAFGGFSMGSVTTWNAFMENMDAIAYFLPLSGDCWAVEPLGGKSHPDETAEILHDKAWASGYKPNEYFIYTMTGTKDIAFDQLLGQVMAMRKYPDTFIEAGGFAAGNFLWHFEEEFIHSYECVCQYVYWALPWLFKA